MPSVPIKDTFLFPVTYSSTSPIPLPSPHDVSSELLQPENKAKQLQTLPVPIPVGEVSPVSLKRSPGPAIHSGLPPVLPIIGPGIKTQGAASSHPVVRSGLNCCHQYHLIWGGGGGGWGGVGVVGRTGVLKLLQHVTFSPSSHPAPPPSPP